MADILEPETQDQEQFSSEKQNQLKVRALSYIKEVKTDMDTLNIDRAKIQKAIDQEPYGDEIKGRSQIVTSELWDTIESILPSLMKIFTGGEDVCNLRPIGPEDVEAAKLLEQKLNFDVLQQNDGFLVFYDWFKDALAQKMGVVKWHWDKHDEFKEKNYEGLTPQEFMPLTMNPDYIVDDVTVTYTNEVNEMITIKDKEQLPILQNYHHTMTINVEGRQVEHVSQPVIECLPPEEFIFDVHAKSIKDLKFCAHKKPINKLEVKKYGLDPDEITAEIARFDDDPTAMERFADLGGYQYYTDAIGSDYVYLYECYFNDHDKGGNKVPIKITLIGDNVVDCEENSYGRPPFSVLSPYRVPHRLIGKSVAEIIYELQQLKTHLVRFIMDALYFSNNQMKVVNPFRINITELITNNRPGGLVSTKVDVDPSSAIFPIPNAGLPSHTLQMLEFIDEMKENRTGSTRYNQGLDANSLNKTASGISMIMNAAQLRMELLARLFAETGVTDLIESIADMNIQFLDQQTALKINNEWKFVKPEDIDCKYDVMIDVGVGTGTSEMKVQQLMQMLNTYQMLGHSGVPIFTDENIYNIVQQIWELLGFKNSAQFLSTPDQTQEYKAKEQIKNMQMQHNIGEIAKQINPPPPPQPPAPPQGMPPQGMPPHPPMPPQGGMPPQGVPPQGMPPR